MKSLNIQTCKLHDYVGTGPCFFCAGEFCERCEERCTEFANKDELLCQSCVENANEAAYERYMDRQVSGGIDYAHQQARAKACK